MTEFLRRPARGPIASRLWRYIEEEASAFAPS
jgi:hypothetical protein